MNELVTVIVPIYNASSFLEECISSVQKQTYKNLEIILINDGSNDNSLSICEFYSKKDSRIKIFNINNSGASFARNLGLKNAHGEYILFVDADDFLEIQCVEKCISVFDSKDVDVVVFGWNCIEEKKENIVYSFESNLIDGKTMLENISTDDFKCGGGFLWNKMFKYVDVKNKKVEFLVGQQFYEDKLWIIKMIGLNTKICLSNFIGYNYRIHYNSLSHKKNIRGKCVDVLNASILIEEEIFGKNLKTKKLITYFENIKLYLAWLCFKSQFKWEKQISVNYKNLKLSNKIRYIILKIFKSNINYNGHDI